MTKRFVLDLFRITLIYLSNAFLQRSTLPFDSFAFVFNSQLLRLILKQFSGTKYLLYFWQNSIGVLGVVLYLQIVYLNFIILLFDNIIIIFGVITYLNKEFRLSLELNLWLISSRLFVFSNDLLCCRWLFHLELNLGNIFNKNNK